MKMTYLIVTHGQFGEKSILKRIDLPLTAKGLSQYFHSCVEDLMHYPPDHRIYVSIEERDEG